jgi:hypothetical protein
MKENSQTDSLYQLIRDFQKTNNNGSVLPQILYEIEKNLAQKLDRVEFSQIIQTKANVEDILALKQIDTFNTVSDGRSALETLKDVSNTYFIQRRKTEADNKLTSLEQQNAHFDLRL